MQVLLGLQDIGPAPEQRRRQAGRDRRIDERLDGLAARDAAGIAAEEHREQVLLLRDLALEGRHGGLRLAVLRLDLRALHFRYRAALVASLEESQRSGIVLGRVARDLELA